MLTAAVALERATPRGRLLAPAPTGGALAKGGRATLKDRGAAAIVEAALRAAGVDLAGGHLQEDCARLRRPVGEPAVDSGTQTVADMKPGCSEACDAIKDLLGGNDTADAACEQARKWACSWEDFSGAQMTVEDLCDGEP